MRKRSDERSSLLKSLPDFRSGVKSSEDETDRSRRAKRKSQARRAASYLAVFALFVSVIWTVFALRIDNVQVAIVTDEVAFVPLRERSIESAAENYLDESFLNRWFVDEVRLVNRITNDVSAVDTVNIVNSSGGGLTLEVTARKRAVVWQKDKAFYEVDTAGFAFREADDSLLSTNILVVDESRLPVEIGQPVATTNFVRAITDLVALGSQGSQKIEFERFISPESPRELHFKLEGKPYTVKTLIGQEPEVVLAALTDILQHFEEKGGAPSQTLDLRVDGRAVYR